MDPIDNAAAIIAIARLAETNKLPVVQQIGNHAVLLKNDGTIIDLEEYEDAPRRKRATVSLYELASFIAYVNRHKQPGTAIFARATETSAAFNAVIDYHGETPSGAPARGEHRVSLSLEVTPEWARWMGKNGTYMTQEQFAEFIEDNLTDIVRPDAAAILEMAQGLQGKKTVQFKSGKALKDGAIKLEYVETIEVQGTATRRDDSLQVPDKFTLGIIPFVGDIGIEVEARLRYRIANNGQLSFAFILTRPFKVVEAAFLAARDAIEEKTSIPVALGDVSL